MQPTSKKTHSGTAVRIKKANFGYCEALLCYSFLEGVYDYKLASQHIRHQYRYGETMIITQYVVDAFTDRVFSGNPAAVCILNAWLEEDTMRKMAKENNLSETAFAVREADTYHLRWFTPAVEVNLCGHATLATAYILLRFFEPDHDTVRFDTRSGLLTVEKHGDLLTMDFPGFELQQVPVTEAFRDILGYSPLEVYKGEDLVFVLENEEQVRSFLPDQDLIRALDADLLHITAPGSDCDCVTRSFAPKHGVPEDPVCGRGHCHVAPYWAKRLGKTQIAARQASERGGMLLCSIEDGRVKLSGNAALYSKAEVYLP